jgi:hypothetical protein
LSLEPLDVAPLPSEFSALPINLALLIGCSAFLSLELVSDQTTTQSAHSPADCRASAWVAYCAPDDRATRRTYSSSQQRTLFSSTQWLRTSPQEDYQRHHSYAHPNFPLHFHNLPVTIRINLSLLL